MRADLFWKKVHKTNDCWLWVGSKLPKPFDYGQFNIGQHKTARAHRVSWMLANGPIPSGLCVLHKCDVYSCVNPEHLFLGTVAENVADMVQKGRQRGAVGNRNISHKKPEHRRGVNNGRAKLDASAVTLIRCDKRRTSELATAFNVSIALIYKIRSREVWKHIA